MQTQTVEFAVESKDKTIQRVGKSTIYQPKTDFKGGKIHWHEDKLKEGGANNDSI